MICIPEGAPICPEGPFGVPIVAEILEAAATPVLIEGISGFFALVILRRIFSSECFMSTLKLGCLNSQC